ncbi:MAG: hypothetical protein WKF75_05630 [Singulisphaera sp.]
MMTVLGGLTMFVLEIRRDDSGEAGVRLRLRELGIARAREIAEWTAERRGSSARSTPVTCGRRSRSWREEADRVTFLVVATADYAAAVEFGHVAPDGSFVGPRPFLRPALADARRHFGLE